MELPKLTHVLAEIVENYQPVIAKMTPVEQLIYGQLHVYVTLDAAHWNNLMPQTAKASAPSDDNTH
jgi:hypothetical protein